MLTPLVEAAAEPIPLAAWTQKCHDLLLPVRVAVLARGAWHAAAQRPAVPKPAAVPPHAAQVLERQQEVTPHEFKSQWGR